MGIASTGAHVDEGVWAQEQTLSHKPSIGVERELLADEVAFSGRLTCRQPVPEAGWGLAKGRDDRVR